MYTYMYIGIGHDHTVGTYNICAIFHELFIRPIKYCCIHLRFKLFMYTRNTSEINNYDAKFNLL